MDDARLVGAAVAGDRDAFGALYDRYADRIHDFAWRVLRNREDAADVTQDTFLVAAQRLGQLRDASKLRPWLFAIARNECTRRGKARARVVASEEVDDVAAPGTTPDDAAASGDVARLLWEAADGLSERDRMLLELHMRHGLEGEELGRAIGVSTQHAYVLVARLREQVERSLGSLLIARQGSKECPDLAEILRGWDGRMSPLLRKRVARHVDGCEVCDRRRAALLSPAALLAAAPILPAPSRIRERVLERMELVSSERSVPDDPWDDEGFPPVTPAPDSGGRRRLAWVAAAVLFVVVLAGGGAVAARRGTPPSSTLAGSDRTTTTASEAVAAGEVDATTTTISVPPSETTTTLGPTVMEATTTTMRVPAGAPGTPASLVLSTSRIDFGVSMTAADVSIANGGGTASTWSTTGAPSWLSLSPSTGTLAPGQSQQVRVSIDRARAPEGDLSVAVAFGWSGRSSPLTVTATVDRPPVVTELRSSEPTVYTDGCKPSQTELSASVGDESGLKSVTVNWYTSAGQKGDATMSSGGDGRYAATVGPFTSPVKVTWTVTAVDARGNSSSSSPETFVVTDCGPG